MSEDKKDFVIKDRRAFNTGGEEQEEPAEKTEAPEAAETTEQPGTTEPTSESEDGPAQLPQINFQTFIFSLNASVLVQLGVMEDPATGKKEKNLTLAKQTIDILSMLGEKTAGNLNDDENNLLKSILYDLRMRYVKEKG